MGMGSGLGGEGVGLLGREKGPRLWAQIGGSLRYRRERGEGTRSHMEVFCAFEKLKDYSLTL